MRFALLMILLAILAPCSGTLQTAEEMGARRVAVDTPSAELKVMFWWWTQPEWNAGIEMSNPPKKTVYSELNKWKYSDMEDSRYPHEVDMVATFKNSRSLGRGEVRFFAAGKYADLEFVQDDNEDKEQVEFVSSQFEKLSWLNEKQVASEVIDFASGDDAIAVSKELDLSDLLNSKSGNKYICGIRVRMEFVNAEGTVTASDETWFPVILGD